MQLITKTHDLATLAKLDCELQTKDIEWLFQLLDRHQKSEKSNNQMKDDFVDSTSLPDLSVAFSQDTRDIILSNAPATQNELIVTAKTMAW